MAPLTARFEGMPFEHDGGEFKPDGKERISITLRAAASCSDNKSICTHDERELSHSTSASVAGPVGISIADARVQEAAGAVLAFIRPVRASRDYAEYRNPINSRKLLV